jgi:hypothetical protein
MDHALRPGPTVGIPVSFEVEDPMGEPSEGADLLLLVPKLQLGNTSVQKLQLR